MGKGKLAAQAWNSPLPLIVAVLEGGDDDHLYRELRL
jgi:hypothetical protein